MFNIIAKQEPQKLVSGWASVSKDKDGKVVLDYQGDYIDPIELEKAVVEFMLYHRNSGVMHEGNVKATVVESIVFTKEKQKALGIPVNTVPEGWFITVKLHDDALFKDVISGKYKMFSIQGIGTRTKIK